MTTKQSLWVIYLIYFLYNLHLSFGLYINSSFLGSGCGCGIPESWVGILFTAGSLLSIILTLSIRRLSTKLGSSKRLVITSGIVTILALLGMIFLSSPWLVGLSFIAYWAVTYLFLVTTDIFVEEYSSDGTTGDTRGVFLSVAGLAVMIAPFFAGRLSERPDGFLWVYGIGILLVSLAMLVVFTWGQKLKEPRYEKAPILPGLAAFFRHPNLTGAFVGNFALQFFYSWMIVYTPIYLIESIGLSWTQVGIIFTIMLIPFVIFEVPLGRIADRWLGEKELMIGGIILMTISTASLAFVTSEALWVWMALLFATRVGASALQVASESHFFKHVTEENVSAIGIFRQTGPLAFMAGSFIATLLLSFTNIAFSALFVILGLLLLAAIPYIARMRDTK